MELCLDENSVFFITKSFILLNSIFWGKLFVAKLNYFQFFSDYCCIKIKIAHAELIIFFERFSLYTEGTISLQRLDAASGVSTGPDQCCF